MADFVAVLTKTIDGLGERNTPDMRQRVYDKARKTIADKLAAITPPPSPEQAGRQYRLLDEAIQTVEGIYAPPVVEVKPPVITPAVVKPAPVAPVKAPVVVAPVAPTPAPYRDPLEDFMASVESDLAKKPALPKPVDAPAAVILAGSKSADALLVDQIKISSPDPVLGMDGHDPWQNNNVEAAPTRKKSGAGLGLVYGVLGLALIGGAGYAGYTNKDKLQTMLGMAPAPATPAKPVVKPAAVTPAVAPAKPVAVVTPAVEPAKPATPEVAATTAPAATEVPKFTQRLTADGQEIDAGKGAAPQDVGEGSTVAAATTPATTPTTPAAMAPAAIAVGQKAIFYEEKTGTEAGSADQGDVVWSVVQDSPGLDQPPEAAIRGEINIPDKGMKVKLTIKRNADKSLPASHIVEMLLTTPADFAGGAIENVQRMALKDTEQAPGNPLVGVPASFGDGFFLVALTDEKTAIETNMTLLKRENWIDVPVAYRSGRRALLSFEKGLAGDKVFQDVFKSWEAK